MVLWPSGLSGNEFQVITSLAVDHHRRFDRARWRRCPCRPSGPSTSMPSVLPSREKEWQFAQEGMPRQHELGCPAARRPGAARR